jgi:NAD(P)-dependent dehydrogenase (short-subunit alcohol dehydrogenase family)
MVMALAARMDVVRRVIQNMGGSRMLKKKIIVTGASYGIGDNLVAALAAEGASVAAMARSVDLGEKQAAKLTAKGPGTVKFYKCDVSNRAQVKQAFAAAAKDMGGVDSLVDVAGVEIAGQPETQTDEHWDHMMNINAKGTFITNQEVFPYLKEKGGRIINFGSGAGILGMAAAPIYSASKAAICGWTRSIAMAWGKHNITANVVNPCVWTPMYRSHREHLTPDELKAHDADLAQRIYIGGQLGDTDRDLIPLMLFLLGDGAGFITGQVLNVDGGIVMAR